MQLGQRPVQRRRTRSRPSSARCSRRRRPASPRRGRGPVVSSSRMNGARAGSAAARSASRAPSSAPTFTTVKTNVRSSTARTAGRGRAACSCPARPTALLADQLGEAELLEREPDEEVERVAEDGADRRAPPGRAARTGRARGRRAWRVTRRRRQRRIAASAAAAVRAGKPVSPPGPVAHVLRFRILVIWLLARVRGCLTLDASGEDRDGACLQHVRILDLDPVGCGRDEPAGLRRGRRTAPAAGSVRGCEEVRRVGDDSRPSRAAASARCS